jgi:hypothetical protein
MFSGEERTSLPSLETAKKFEDVNRSLLQSPPSPPPQMTDMTHITNGTFIAAHRSWGCQKVRVRPYSIQVRQQLKE